MPAIILYPLAFIVVLGIMIVVHEFGHFAAAKLLGVRVEVFSVGFGKRLLGFRRGDTDYRISALPLGGYVKMSGENPMDERTGDPAEFMSHPRWHRFIIAIAGPAMNIVMAIFLLTGIYSVHYSVPVFFDQPAVLGWVAPGSAADRVGIKVGDRITQIDGIRNPNWEQVIYRELLNPNQPLPVTVQRGGQTLNFTVIPEPRGLDRVGDAGWDADFDIKVTGLEHDMPAEKAGVKEGDEITAVDGIPVRSMAAMLHLLQEKKGSPSELTVVRDGQTLKLTVQPKLTPVEGYKEPLYRVGIRSNVEKVMPLSLGDAFRKSLEDNRKNSLLALELIQKLIRAKASLRQMEGPLRIGQAAGEAAQEKGWIPLLKLMSAISLQLGIFNLLPIPILDGGVILLLLIEGTIRRDISLPVKERIYQAAFVFLILFATVVIYNDISKLIAGRQLP
jgi:regulator of sigma E protease